VRHVGHLLRITFNVKSRLDFKKLRLYRHLLVISPCTVTCDYSIALVCLLLIFRTSGIWRH